MSDMIRPGTRTTARPARSRSAPISMISVSRFEQYQGHHAFRSSERPSGLFFSRVTRKSRHLSIGRKRSLKSGAAIWYAPRMPPLRSISQREMVSCPRSGSFAQPTRHNGQHEEHLYPCDIFPFTYGTGTDEYRSRYGKTVRRGKPDGILATTAGEDERLLPKVMHTQSAAEYWHRSGSLVHTDTLGTKDVDIPANVRIYAFGGTQHGPARRPPGRGDADNPLLVSVRSGARASMPGMMDTVLNLGLNDVTVEALAKGAGDERFAYDS